MDPRAIAHARVEAQRLLVRTKDPRFEPPQSLGAAHNLIAVLKGFPHWHALIASSRPDAKPATPMAASAPPGAPALSPRWPMPSLTPGQRLLPRVGDAPRSSGVFARPGSGKSLMLALQVLDHAWPHLDNLPRVAVIDIGPSARGMVDTLRAHLPPARGARQVHHHRVGLATRLNPFDLPLGLRAPIGRDRRTKGRWLQQALSPEGGPALPEVVVMDLLDALYARGTTPEHAVRYRASDEPCLATFLARVDPLLPQVDHLTWWDVMDACMDHDRPDLARRAQRRAVPTLNVLYQHLPSLDVHPAHRLGIAENLKVLRNGWLSEATNVDWDDARVVVLDLDEACRHGGTLAQHLTAVSYFGARVVLGVQPGLVDPDERGLAGVLHAQGVRTATARRYDAWHSRQHQQTPGSVMVFDELHRAGNNPWIVQQLLADLQTPHRSVMLASQVWDILVEPVNGERLLDRLDHLAILDTVKTQDLHNRPLLDALRLAPEQAELLNDVPSIVQPGAHHLRLDRTLTRWSVERVPRERPPGVVLWALSTTHDDVALRQRLVPAWGWDRAMDLLAQRFPNGTCKAVFHERPAGILALNDEPSRIEALVDEVWTWASGR